MVSILQSFLADRDGVKLRPYSGRGMSGKKNCVAVTVHNPYQFLWNLVWEVAQDEDSEQYTNLPHGVKVDTMGTDSVVYWPTEEWHCNIPNHSPDCTCGGYDPNV